MGSWLFGSKKAQNQSSDPQPTAALRFQTSIQGKPLPIVAGQTRIAANVIWYGDFYALASSSAPAQGGGKGGVAGGGGSGKGGQQGTVTYTYFVSVAFGLCEGPISGVLDVWNNKAVDTAADWGFTIFSGGYSQTAWGYLTTSHPGDAYNYRGLAYAAQAGMSLGANDSLPNLSWEVKGTIADAVAGRPDANPKDVIVDWLTNDHYGVGFPIARLDTAMLSASSYWLSLGLLISPALVEQKEMSSTLNELLQGLNCGSRWSGGILSFVPWGDTAVSNGSVSLVTENAAVPSSWPYSLLVAHSGKFVSDQGVSYHGAGALTKVVGTPSAGQYAVDNLGNYTFAAADAAASVDISYDFAANSAFVPDVTPLYDIDEDTLQPNQGTGGANGLPNSAPILWTRKPRSQLLNRVTVEFLDRANNYDPGTVDAKDQASIDVYGERASGSRQNHFFCVADTAVLSAHLQLNREQIAATCVFTLGPKFVLVDVEDILTLTYAPQGLDRQPVRVTEIQEQEDGCFVVTAEEYLGTAGAPLYGQQAGSGAQTNTNVDPGTVNAPVIFEPTYTLANDLEVWVGVSGVDPTVWGGCDVWLSLDGTNYQKQPGTILGAARTGELTADLPSVTPASSGQTIDDTNTLSVDLSESGGVLTSGTVADAQAYNTLCYVDGEYIAYETAMLTSTSHYDLTYLVRGAFGSDIGAHLAGTKFLRLDNAIFKIPFTQDRVGQTIYVKFLSYNVWGGGQQSLADVTPYTFTIAGSGPPPDVTGFSATVANDTTTLSWDPVTVFNLDYYEVRFTTNTASPAWNAAVLVASGITGTSIQVPTQLGAYLVKAHNTLGLYSANAAIVELFVDPATQRNVVITIDEQPTFAGVCTNCFAAASELRLSGTNVLNDWATLDSVLPSIAYYEGVAPSGEYDFANVVDLGAVFPCRLTLNTSVHGEAPNYVLNDWTTLDGVTTLDGGDLGTWTFEIEVATSNDGVTYGGWTSLIAGDYTARAFKFRALLDSDGVVTPVVDELEIVIDMPDRMDSQKNLVCAPGVNHFNFTTPFNGISGLTITAKNLSQGLGYSITGETLSGFSLEFVDSVGNPVSFPVTFDYIARGWGSQQ